jgi:hypothetical protein
MIPEGATSPFAVSEKIKTELLSLSATYSEAVFAHSLDCVALSGANPPADAPLELQPDATNAVQVAANAKGVIRIGNTFPCEASSRFRSASCRLKRPLSLVAKHG